MQPHLAEVRDNLLPDLRLRAAADDAKIKNFAALAKNVQDLAQAAAYALEYRAQKVLAPVLLGHAEEHALRLFVINRRPLAL